MNVAVFGATGRLGRDLLDAALARGHHVTAHSRRPTFDVADRLAWITGDSGQAVKDADVVLIAFGPRSPRDEPFCRLETDKVLEAMRALGKRRVLCVTGAMVGDYPANRTWFFRQFAGWIRKRYPQSMKDRDEQEATVRSSGLEWTVFKPPRLTIGPPKATVVGPAVRVGMRSSVSRTSLARVMVNEAEQGRFIREAVFVKESASAASWLPLPKGKMA